MRAPVACVVAGALMLGFYAAWRTPLALTDGPLIVGGGDQASSVSTDVGEAVAFGETRLLNPGGSIARIIDVSLLADSDVVGATVTEAGIYPIRLARAPWARGPGRSRGGGRRG